MRKVFISTVPMQKTQAVKNRSRDFDLGDKDCKAPISYLLDANIEPGDEILILTGTGTREWPQKNYGIRGYPQGAPCNGAVRRDRGAGL